MNIKLLGFLINIFLNYIFIFSLKLGVVGAALGTTISYSMVMIFSLYNFRHLKITINFISHFTWFFWLLIFNLPTLIIINAIKEYINSGYLIIVTTFITLFLSTLIAILTFFGPEKKLVLEMFKRIIKLKL